MTPPPHTAPRHQRPSMNSNHHSTGPEPIDYDELDDEIVDLVYLMNQFEGIRTTFSCAGHTASGYATGYVQFRANSLDDLEHLLDHIPHSSYGLGGKPVYRGSAIAVRYGEGELQFTLRLGGMNESVQREWIAETETTLRNTCPLCRRNGYRHN
jgi:hypothetical protein